MDGGMNQAIHSGRRSNDAGDQPWMFDIEAPMARWCINILVVEDDPADTSLILSALKHHPDVASAHAMDRPDAALQLLASGSLQPDLILLDIHMPRIDGFGFMERLRRIPGMFDTPVAFLTTSRLASNVEAARELTVSHYVVKPDTFADLQARLNVVIKRIKSGAWSSK
jgi:CheY-like chemotaxis protein